MVKRSPEAPHYGEHLLIFLGVHAHTRVYTAPETSLYMSTILGSSSLRV